MEEAEEAQRRRGGGGSAQVGAESLAEAVEAAGAADGARRRRRHDVSHRVNEAAHLEEFRLVKGPAGGRVVGGGVGQQRLGRRPHRHERRGGGGCGRLAPHAPARRRRAHPDSEDVGRRWRQLHHRRVATAQVLPRAQLGVAPRLANVVALVVEFDLALLYLVREEAARDPLELNR